MPELSSFIKNKNKPESHQKVCENKYFCALVMLSEDNEILKFNQYKKSAKMPSIINAGLESLIKKWMDVKIILKNHLQL